MANANVDTFMNRAGTDNGHGNNLPIELVEIPEPEILSLTSLPGAGEVELDIRVAATAAGNYVQDGCACGPVGFRIVQQSVPMGAKPDPGAPWAESTPVGGGSQLLATPGDTVPVESPCPEGNDLYLATRLTFDSGFETDVVSPPTRVRCSQCVGIDADGDGFCKEAGNGVAADCDDGDPTVHPNAEQICDGLNNDCGHPTWPALAGTNEVDLDGDGLSECNGDCDDTNPTIGVAAAEVCDGVNNDCHDPQWPDLPENEADLDGDGWTACGGDCDDSNSAVFPGAPELACDGVKNNCDDASWPSLPIEETDADWDGVSVCDGDCDDSSAYVRPYSTEVCNGIDDNCDGKIDEGADGVDSDVDGIADSCDNCTATYNPDQLDSDGDGLGNACDMNTVSAPSGEPSNGEFDTSYIIVKLTTVLESEASRGYPSTITGVPALDNLIQDTGVHAIEVGVKRFPNDLRIAELAVLQGLDRIYKFHIPSGADVYEVADQFAQITVVEYASPAYFVHLSGNCPDDPHFTNGDQWAFNSTTGKDVDGPEAWEISTGTSDVVVAVVDSGIQADHGEVRLKVVPGYDATDPGANPDDAIGHGTFVSSVAAAQTCNFDGIAGSCWNCGVMPIKIFDSVAFGDPMEILDGITEAVDLGARIMNYSWGRPDDVDEIRDAIVFASNAGAIQVAATGNDNHEGIDFPAKYGQTIAVGATDQTDTRWTPGLMDCQENDGSNYGDQIDVVAPGAEMWGAVLDQTIPMNEVGELCGTSFSTPLVTGLIGLMLSVNPTLGQEEARHLIRVGAEDQVGPLPIEPEPDPEGFDIRYGYGRVNMHKTLQATAASATLTVDVNPASGNTVIELPVFNPLADSYDFIRGYVSNLSKTSSAPVINLGDVECLGDDSLVSSIEDAQSPAPGQGFFYLARFNSDGPAGPGFYGGPYPNRFQDRIATGPNNCLD